MKEIERSDDQEYFNDNNGPFYRKVDNPDKDFDFCPDLGLDIERAPKIGLIEDNLSLIDGLSRRLNGSGFNTVGFQINSAIYPPSSPTLERAQLQMVCDEILQDENCILFFIDRGLGYFDGIELVRRFAEKIPTVMITGDFLTDETRGLCQARLEKPYNTEELLDIIRSLTGFSPVK